MKWSLIKNKARSLLRSASASRKAWLLSSAALGVLAALTVSFILPGNSYAGIGNNDLLLVGQHCHDLHDITYDFGMGGNASKCHYDKSISDPNGGWEEVLNDNLGCSTSMFYKHDFLDPHDSSAVTKSLWYTKQADYKDCYEKAQTMYNAMSGSKDCKLTKNGSDNYNKCTGYQDKLHETLGCDSSMFQSADSNGKPDPNGDYYIIKPGASGDCQNRIDAVGAVHIIVIGSNGKPQPSPNPISSQKVADLGGVNGGGSASSDQLSCDESSNPLTWIICPIINDILVPAIGYMDNIITEQMVVQTQYIFCGTSDPTCAAYYSAWASFRNIALGLLAVAGLITVIAQAIGIEILDAYTIRKMLPRVLIAAVTITLSWPLMNFAVTVSNNLGFGVRDLIIAPFHSLSSTININFTDGLISNFFSGVVGVPIWMAAGGTGVLFSYLGSALVATLVAVVVLTLRQIVIAMMIILAPIALIAYVLPNTQRIFRLWWESFVRALLMFPLIAGFIAAGRVFAAISLTNTSSSGLDSILHGIIGFAAYFGPYLLIPMTFNMSGGIMGGLGNMINQRGQGVQGLLSNYRKGQVQQRVARARAEGLYREGFGKYKLRPGGKQRSIGHGLNTIGFWGLNADEMVPYKLGTTKTGKLIDGKEGIPGFRRGGHALESRIKRARRDQTVKAVQDLDIGYKSGRLMGGQFQYFYGAIGDSKNPRKMTDAQKELNEAFAMRDSTGRIMYKDDEEFGKIPVGWNAPNNWGERNRVADIMAGAKGPGGIEAREAASELKATASEFEKYTGSAETNRVDGRLLGLLSAAKAGRLEMEDVADNHNRIFDDGNGDQETAVRETTLLQDALTGKRVSAARGHGMWWDEKGKAHSSYEDPLSAKAASSLMRINNQEIAGSKSEDLDALRETIVAHGSEYEMEMGEDGHVQKKMYKTPDGLEAPRLKSDPIEQERARQVQARLKTLAQYNYGDSDVGVKVNDIWQRLDRNPDELVWGKGGSTDERVARDMAEAGHHPEPEPPPPS